jgi:hypothetical protein
MQRLQHPDQSNVDNTWEKMGIQWSNASAIYRLQEIYDSVRSGGSCITFSLSFVHPWNCRANKNVSDWNLQYSPGRKTLVWHVPIKMVWNKEMPYCHCFSTLF